jgi:acyl-coenzyme A thioesterase PaaI-like protein
MPCRSWWSADPVREGRDDRRHVVGALASSLRALADAATETAVGNTEVAAVTVDVDALAARLAAEHHDGPYSGLHGRELDLSTPAGPLPLSPVIGDCNPSAPEVHLRFEDGRVQGTAVLTRRHVGPPGAAHGGVGAMIADQLVAVTPFLIGLTCVTRTMTVRYRRPIPLARELALEAWCEQVDDDSARAWCTISADGEVVLDADAEMVVAMHVTRPERRP